MDTGSLINNGPVVANTFKVFQNLIEKYLPPELGGSLFLKEYVLREFPKKLRPSVQETIVQIEEPSLTILGYRYFGSRLFGVRAGKHILVFPHTNDCIPILSAQQKRLFVTYCPS